MPGKGSVRHTLPLLLALLLVPVLGVQALIYYGRFEQRRSTEYQANLEVARAVAAAFDAFVDDVLHQELATGRALVLAGDSLGDQQAHELLAASAREYPAVIFYSWLTPDGRVRVSSQPDITNLDLGDREFVQAILQGEPWAVSDLLQERVTGEAAFVIARGLRDPQGNLQGIMAAVMDARRLGMVLAIPRDEQGAVAIADRQGRGVYRYPEVSFTWEQRNWIATQPIIYEALAGRETTGDFLSVVDGRPRMAGLAPIGSIGWVASANRPADTALAPAGENLVRDFILLLAVAAVAASLAGWVARGLTIPLGRLRAHALAVGRGEHPEHIEVEGPAELREVALAFDQMVAEIRARDRQRGELLATVSHDLRNPLAALRAQAQLAKRRLLRGDELERTRLIEVLTGIEASAEQMDALIVELSDSSLAGDGAVELHPAPMDLVDVARRAVDAAQRAADSHTIRVRTEVQSLVGTWDEVRLQRVLGNLLGNAVKYSPAGGDITVCVRRDGDAALVEVTDEGVGIPASDLPYVFLPYRRGRNVGTAGGMGLGLAGAQRLIALHGGTISVRSQEGHGSTFTVWLPVRRPRSALLGENTVRAGISAV